MKPFSQMRYGAGLMALALALGGFFAAHGQSPPDKTMFVYAPVSIKPYALEKMLEEGMPRVDVTVFGRITDFKTAVTSTPPDAALSLRPVLEELKLPIGLQGFANASDAEIYLLLAAGEDVTREQLQSKVVGIVDILGRKRLPQFVALILRMDEPPKIQSVTKTEDLLPLLQFKNADVLLLSESVVADFKSKSQLDLRVSKVEGASVGRAAVSFMNAGKRAAMESAVLGLKPELNKKLGVEQWKKVAP